MCFKVLHRVSKLLFGNNVLDKGEHAEIDSIDYLATHCSQ